MKASTIKASQLQEAQAEIADLTDEARREFQTAARLLSSSYNALLVRTQHNIAVLQVNDLRAKLEALENERDFYFDKLRDIEIMSQWPEVAKLPVRKDGSQSSFVVVSYCGGGRCTFKSG